MYGVKKKAKPVEKKKTKPLVKSKTKALSKSDIERFKEHSKHHSAKHIRKMKFIMTKEGKSFKQAHMMAKKMVGK